MDWLSYAPADLVPFSRETWLALLAAYNRQHLPALPAGIGVALAVLWLTRVGGSRRLRLALVLLGGCWLWIAWAFLYQALGTLLWAAPWLAWGFAAQGLLLVLAAALLPLSAPVAVASWRMPGWWLLVAAVVVWPALAWAAGRDWLAVGWFGSAPDATAVGTLGVLAHAGAQRLAPAGVAGAVVCPGRGAAAGVAEPAVVPAAAGRGGCALDAMASRVRSHRRRRGGSIPAHWWLSACRSRAVVAVWCGVHALTDDKNLSPPGRCVKFQPIIGGAFTRAQPYNDHHC